MNSPKFQYWIFIIIAILYFLILHKFLDVTFTKVKALPVNELGDFLAGTFSPLAFLFLILGYLQTNKSLGQNSEAIAQQAIAIQQQAVSLQMQADELKISNEALQTQAEELRNSVEQQIEQVRISNEQLNFYREKNIEDAQKEIDGAKPILSLKRTGANSNGDTFELKNIGGNAMRTECTRPNINIPNLAKDERMRVSTTITAEFLTLKYKDRLGNQYITEFKKGKSNLDWFDSIDIDMK